MRLFKLFAAVCVALSFSVSKAQDEVATSSTKVPVETGKYITGGIIASTVGLGIGHGIQGRYADKGWIFTATEAAGLTAMIAGFSDCTEETNSNGTKETNCRNNGLGVVGLGVFLGFHIWEIVDAWSGATPVESKVSAFLIPNPKAPGLGLAYSF